MKKQLTIQDIYEKIETLPSGKLNLSTGYCKKLANLIGGSYDDLNKIQKFLFRDDATSERIYEHTDFSKYKNR